MSSKRKWRLARTIVVATLLVVVAVVWGLSKSGVFQTKTNLAQADSTETSATAASLTTSTTSVMPSVGSANETAPVDTTKDPRTPPTFVPFRKSNHVDMTWAELSKNVTDAKAQYYIDAANSHAKQTGFDWSDVQKWANDPQLKNVTPLTIQVYGDFTDSEARAIVAELVGKDQAAALRIFRHPVGILGNTRSVGFEKVGDFLDLRKMVRLSLSPIVYDKNGKAIGVDGNSGVFADCFNIWWLVAPKVAVTPPGGHKPPTSYKPPSTPPTVKRRITPKYPTKDVGVNPHVAPWKQDGGEKHVATRDDGSNRLQTNPAWDAAVAAAKAAAEAAVNAAAQQAAIDAAKATGGGVVDNNQQHSVTTTPGAGW